MRPLTLAEAARFLRMSRSNLYQRKDIPRYRRPGSRALLFDQDELEAWIKQGRMDCEEGDIGQKSTGVNTDQAEVTAVAIPQHTVYHRNPRYR